MAKAAATKGKKAVEKRAEALQTLKIDYAPIDYLKPNPYNPNRQSDHEFELLCRSMREDGFTQPVVAVQVDETHLEDPKFQGKYQKNDVVIVDGFHRWKAAKHIGLKEIPHVIVPMNVEQMRIATLRHNRARGSEDIELSAEVLRDLQQLGALDWAKDSLMLDDAEMNKLLDDIPAPEALAEEEWTEAWEPKKDETYTVEADMKPSASREVAVSSEATKTIETMERKIAEAKTEQDRQAARREANIFRIVLMFTGEQATLVKSVLGERPAEAILELCQKAKGEK